MIKFTTESDDSNGILVCRITGAAETQETRKMGYQMRSQAKLTEKKLILDFSKADLTSISVLDLHLWFKEYYDKLDRDLRTVPTALLANSKNALLFRFVELSWGDQGILTKPHSNQSLAIDWLNQIKI